MPIVVILFFLGTLASALLKKMPSTIYFIVVVLIGLILLIQKKNKKLKYLAIPLFGFIYALVHAKLILNGSLPKAMEDRPILIEGYIISIPTTQRQLTTFKFRMTTLSGKKVSTSLQASYYRCPHPLKVGQAWRFEAKLRGIHSLRNPGCVDQEKQYFYQGILAKANILTSKQNHQLNLVNGHVPLERVRQFIFERLERTFKQHELYGILLALTLGITHQISAQQWQVFRATGTNHLVAISGLHIGLAASCFAKLAAWIWGRIPFGPLVIPIPYISAFAGIISATIYSLLAGFSASTQRALLMISFLVLATSSKRRSTSTSAVCFSLGVILLFEPLAYLSMSFWLSFIAVGLLIYGLNNRIAHSGLWIKWGKPQWVVSLGMMPTLYLVFANMTLLSIPANIIAIPWFSFLVIPCFLVGVIIFLLFEKLGKWLIEIGFYLLSLMWVVLQKISTYHQLIFQGTFEKSMTAVFTHLATYLTLLPTGLFSRVLTLAWWLPSLWPSQTLLVDKQVQLVVFDVGQGLATLIRTKNHVLIFDTGAKMSDDYDMGKAVILPYLERMRIKKIDILTVSHGDNDHIGGAESLLEKVPITKIYTSVPARFKNRAAMFCKENTTWNWDGVNFIFISPPANLRLSGNNASCVLKIANGKQGILLTGDIEQEAENILVERHASILPATILVVPHHGSKTSSSPRFLASVMPEYAIFSAGYLNRYHHPRPEIINRYSRWHSKIFNTITGGAITMTLSPNSDKVSVDEYRKSHQRIWHDKKRE